VRGILHCFTFAAVFVAVFAGDAEGACARPNAGANKTTDNEIPKVLDEKPRHERFYFVGPWPGSATTELILKLLYTDSLRAETPACQNGRGALATM
jgi:hypothetical protein